MSSFCALTYMQIYQCKKMNAVKILQKGSACKCGGDAKMVQKYLDGFQNTEKHPGHQQLINHTWQRINL